MSEVVGQGCGVLRHTPPPGTYEHLRHAPPHDLAAWVEHFWIERWSFTSVAPQKREVLPHPAVHLVFAPGRSRIYGVQLGRFARELSGTCCILGVKFHPGAFYPFLRRPVGMIANTSVCADEILAGATRAAAAVLGAGTDCAMARSACAFLRNRLPARDVNAEYARRIVEEIVHDPTLTRVTDLAQRVGVTERALQRLFYRYVGASPRWVIKRYRTYEALERLANSRGTTMSELAQDLGYFDQAHFINDFKKLTGQPPVAYARIVPQSESVA